jgi:hypothetical protein
MGKESQLVKDRIDMARSRKASGAVTETGETKSEKAELK